MSVSTASASPPSFVSRAQFYIVVVLPGAVLMALEIVSSRVLAPQFGNSVYVWGSIIGVFLAAMSLGYVWGGRLADKRPELAHLGALLVGAAFSQTVVLMAGPRVVEIFGDWTGGAPWGTLLAATVLFGPPTLLLATVAPYAVKLATRDLSLLGGTAGHLYAVSTMGSLAGTLGATFGLIPYLGLTAILRLLLLLTLAAGTIAMAPRFREHRLAAALGLSLVVLAFSGTLSTTNAGQLVAERITPYQTLNVSDDEGVRFWRSDGTLHAAVHLDTLEPRMMYGRTAAAATLFQPEMRHALFLGMGGGSIGPYFQRRLGELEVDYVDIDPVVPELARKVFFFDDVANPRLRVHVDDARRFLQKGDRQWDFIYTDTYIGHSIPFHLATVEFFRELRGRLRDGGVLGINMISSPETPFGGAMVRSVHEVFPQLYMFNVRGGNYLLIATAGEKHLLPEDILARAHELGDEWDFSSPSLVEAARLQRPITIDLVDGMRLEDDFAPVNHLVFRQGDATRDFVPAEEVSEEDRLLDGGKARGGKAARPGEADR